MTDSFLCEGLPLIGDKNGSGGDFLDHLIAPRLSA
jgi:hypothetical protein